MKHKNTGKLISLFALLLVAFSNSLWSAEVDTVWVSKARGSIGLRQNTDNGNIMLMNETAIIEVDKTNGELIQRIDIVCKNPFKHQFSPNNQYIGIEDVNILRHFDILSYPKLDTIYSNIGNLLRFVNNEEIVFLKGGYLNKYNFITKETVIGTDILPSTGLLLTNSDMVVSSKGKYIALQLKSPIQGNDNGCNIDFSLFDGKTLKRIKQLEYWKPSNISYYPTIIFSKDETKLGVSKQNHLENDSTKNQYKIYDLESGKLNVFNTLSDKPFIYSTFCTFGQKYYTIIGKYNDSDNYTFLNIIDIKTNQVRVTLTDLGSTCYFDEIENKFYGINGNILGVCINLNKIINSIENPNNSTEELIINYQNEILEIRTNSINIKRIQVTNLEGIILQNFELPMATDNFVTPLKLPSGMYIIKVIKDKNESLTKKIVVGR
jgi:hypothetical protein